MKELERERMLRVDTEQRLHDMRVESDSCRARLHALQEEFRKMEEMVRDMLQYKSKIDQLKQEKSNLAVTYENNLQKCRNHISTLERENMMLLNQVKKMESQLHGKGDDRDKSRLLLERLKMVEAENSGLVLENEQQRQQYEKCLDQIANQVVQALLAQKTLREECMKLQSRVQDLEMQNQQLNLMFQQRIRFPSDPTMQHMPIGSSTTYVCRAEASQGEVTSAQFLQGSAVSLQSMFSELMLDDSPGHPQMSTPPPWLRDRLELPLDDEISLSSSSSGSPSSPQQSGAHPLAASASHGSPKAKSTAIPVPVVKTRIETEFPANNSSPKVKHISVLERGTRSLERRGAGFTPLVYSLAPSHGSTGSVRKTKTGQQRPAVKHSLSTEAVVHVSAQGGSPASTQGASGSKNQLKAGKKTPSPPAKASTDKRNSPPTGSSGASSANGSTPKLSPLADKVKLRAKSGGAREPSRSPHRNSLPPSMPFRSQYYYDYSDEDSDSRPVSRVFSSASTVSLNELLDTSTEGDLALDDDFFSDWSSMCLSPQHRLPIHSASPQHRLTNQSPLVSNGKSSPAAQAHATHSSPVHRGSEIKMGVQSLSPLAKVALHADSARVHGENAPPKVPGAVKAERDDSGCEVDSSQTDRNSPSGKVLESAERLSEISNKIAGITASEEAETQLPDTCAKSPDASHGDGKNKIVFTSSDEIVVQTSDGSRYKVQSAKTLLVDPPAVRTLSLSKSATKVSLPAPQHGVLLTSSASKLQTKLSVVGQASSVDQVLTDSSPETQLTSALLASSPSSGSDERDVSTTAKDNTSSSLKTSTDMPFSCDLVASVISREAFGCTPKLMSQPLTTEEKTRACRPDQLILAPAEKHFSFHGFTSGSSTSSEDKSPLKLAHPKQASVPSESGGNVSKHANISVTNSGDNSALCSKPKKTPPPVPKKPSWAGSPVKSTAPAEIPSVGEKSGNSGAGDKNSGYGKFPADTTLTVGFMSCQPHNLDTIACNPDTVRDYVNSLVKDMKERVARHSEWTASAGTAPTTTITSSANAFHHCKSLDSSFESLRAERSGSKDDGYSTMSSDIHPTAMEKYAYADTPASKPCMEGPSSVVKVCEGFQEAGKAECPSLKRRDKSIETSDPDSAMETSTHSMDTRTSSQSLSSQVSSSSGENVLSPVNKVTRMARFFEDEAVKGSHSSVHKFGSATPSPLSPCSQTSITSPDSSLCLSPNDGDVHTCVSSPSKISHGRWGSSSHGSSSSVVSVTCGHQITNTSPAVRSPLFSSSCSPCSPVAEKSPSDEHVKDDACDDTQENCKTASSLPSPHQLPDSLPSHAEKPVHIPSSSKLSDCLPSSNLADIKLPITRSPSIFTASSNTPKPAAVPVNMLHSPSSSRREYTLSWPPRKQLSSPVSPPQPAATEDVSVAGGWTFAASPLHISEDKFLDDIPEESSDEWDNLYVHTVQELQQRNQQHKQQQQQRTQEQRSSNSSGRIISWSFDWSHACLTKAKSETNLYEKQQAASLYDEMMSGSWDSSKVLERSASVSEMDCRSRSVCAEERSTLHRTAGKLSLDEVDVDQRVALITGKTFTMSDSVDESEGEMETKKQLNDLWNMLMAQQPLSLPAWKPQQTAEELKKSCTPSPASLQKMDGSSAEDWLLRFTKEEIEKHTAPKSAARKGISPLTRNSQDEGWDSKRVHGLDLSQIVQPGADNVLEVQCDTSQSMDEGESSECSPRSPSAEQKLFHSEFYSLCLVESNRSLVTSSMEGMHERGRGDDGDSHQPHDSSDPNSFQSRLPHPSYIREGIHVREFDEISHQIASLTRTVDELNRSLNSLNSGESGDSNQDLRSCGATGGLHEEGASGDAGAAKHDYVDGYHWVDDEFYLTSCGGEVIIGSSALLEDDDEDLGEGAGEEGGFFHLQDNDDAIADDAQDDFYCIRIPHRSESKGPHGQQDRPSSGYLESEQVLASLAQFRYNSDGQLDRQNTGGGGDPTARGWITGTSSSHTSLSHLHPVITSKRGQASEENLLADREHRANLLDSMLPSGESNDSLSSDIGLDHMMCQRLMGRKGKMDAVRFALPKQRPAVDFTKFFLRYGKPEQDAVAAFDFLEDIPTSDSGSENLGDSLSRRSRSASHPLSREVVMRQAEARRSVELRFQTSMFILVMKGTTATTLFRTQDITINSQIGELLKVGANLVLA
nr:hypothetical protein BaRGS_000275 [Batillaria attramentaria]